MIIASIFAFFYFCLCPDARNHRQSVLDSPPFFMFLCFAVFLICSGLFLLEFQLYFVPRSIIQNNAVHCLSSRLSNRNVCSQFTLHIGEQRAVSSIQQVKQLWSSLAFCLVSTARFLWFTDNRSMCISRTQSKDTDRLNTSTLSVHNLLTILCANGPQELGLVPFQNKVMYLWHSVTC